MRQFKSSIATIVHIMLILVSTGYCGSLRQGQTIKIITTGGQQYLGRFHSMNAETITLSSQWDRKAIDRADIAKILKGGRATVRGSILGLFAGVAAGFIYYALTINEPDYENDVPHSLKDYASEFLFFGSLGLLGGMAIGITHRTWTPVDQTSLTISDGPTDGGEFRMQVSLRF